MKKTIFVGLAAIFLMGCELRLKPLPQTVIQSAKPTAGYAGSHSPSTHDVCLHDNDPWQNNDLYFEYCSYDDSIYCLCEMYYNWVTGCEEEWCNWDNICGWELSEEWCY